jgi:hypothetical protein
MPGVVPSQAENNAELTCSRVICHVWYSVPPEALPLLVGCSCPTCGIGVLERRRADSRGFANVARRVHERFGAGYRSRLARSTADPFGAGADGGR